MKFSHEKKIALEEKVLRGSLPSGRETRKIKAAGPSPERAKRYFRTWITYVCVTQLAIVAKRDEDRY